MTPQVVEEFEASRAHYEKLGIAERIELDLHEIAQTYPKTNDRFGETLSWKLPNSMNSD